MTVNPDFLRLLEAEEGDRRDLFAATALRLGTTLQNIEKDFWVCWTLDALFNDDHAVGPRLLFKGGTSLSKGYGLIARFSEDIDITVFRDDLGVGASVEALEAMSGKRRSRQLDAIRSACQTFIAGALRERLAARAASLPGRAGTLRITADPGDPDGQSLLLWYPAITSAGDGYIQPAVKIEAGAKSALDPHRPVTVKPYVGDDLPGFDLTVPGVTVVEPTRTFWDKVVILHGLRRWYERRGELRGGGQRVSRHYYDIDRLMRAEIGREAVRDLVMAGDCVRHARMFFNRPDLDLASARPGSFALLPHDGMVDELRRDYAAMRVMIFGDVPSFEEVLASVQTLEGLVNEGRGGGGAPENA
jgi:hypothetical protein